MALIQAGRVGLHEQPLRSVWRRVGGNEYERSWIGTEVAIQKYGLAATAGATEVSIQRAPGSVLATLTARYAGVLSGQEQAVEVIDIDFVDQTFPLNQNPTFIGLTTATITDLEKKIEAHDENPYSEEASVEWSYYELRSRKVDTYRVKLPTVVWSRTVSLNYPVALDLQNAGAIFSTGELAGSIGAPILFTIPTGNVGVSEDDATLFTRGWFKGAKATNSSDGKIQIVLTAEYGLWANDAYVFIR